MKLALVMTVYLINVNMSYVTVPAFADNIQRKVTLFLLKQKLKLRDAALFLVKKRSIYMFYNIYWAIHVV